MQPYFESLVHVGRYEANWSAIDTPNFYNFNLRTIVRAGATSWLDVQITPQISFKKTESQSSFGFADLPITLNLQLLTYKITDPWPSIRLFFRASIPCGKYQKLNPNRLRTDLFGNGCWYPEIAIASSKLWHTHHIHYLETRLYFGYRVGVPTSVKGFNFYGGDATTNGTAYPGNIFFCDFAFEYNLSKNWALASDFYYEHRNASRFSGKTTLPATLHSSEGLSIAPALEYNFSKTIGIIGGIWFSILGRNTSQFINGMISLNAYL